MDPEEHPYDKQFLARMISGHTSNRFKDLRDALNDSRLGHKCSDRHMRAAMQRFSEYVAHNKTYQEDTIRKTGLDLSTEWMEFLLHIIMIRCKILDNWNFFFDYQKNIDYLEKSRDIALKIKTDFFKDSLVDWILALAGYSKKRLLVILPSDFSVVSYSSALIEALSFNAENPTCFEGVVSTILELSPKVEPKNESKIILMSTRTLLRLFMIKRFVMVEMCDLVLVKLLEH